MFKRVHEIHEKFREDRPSAVLPKRYTLLPNSKQHAEEDERFESMKVKVIRYECRTGDYKEIEEFLEDLCNLAGISVYPEPAVSFPEEETI